MDENKTIIVRASIDKNIWKYVMLYKIHNNLNDREKALEEIICLGWERYKEIEQENNEQ